MPGNPASEMTYTVSNGALNSTPTKPGNYKNDRPAVIIGTPMGIPMNIGTGTAMNPRGPVRILWRFWNGCDIKRKRVKDTIKL